MALTQADTVDVIKGEESVTRNYSPLMETDTIPEEIEPQYGLLLTAPEPPEAVPYRDDSNGVSFILAGLFLLCLIISLRYRNNIKYVVSMFSSLMETRTRSNIFNDTVRETSLIVMLNVMWCACAGIIGYSVMNFLNPGMQAELGPAIGMLIGMGFAVAYVVFLWIAYRAVGLVFSDRGNTELWIKGFSASQALMAPPFFVMALVAVCSYDSAIIVGITSALVFLIGKMIFIWKGYRIFFNQISSWVLFLCYLCSLEIVPLILCYRFAYLLEDAL